MNTGALFAIYQRNSIAEMAGRLEQFDDIDESLRMNGFVRISQFEIPSQRRIALEMLILFSDLQFQFRRDRTDGAKRIDIRLPTFGIDKGTRHFHLQHIE